VAFFWQSLHKNGKIGDVDNVTISRGGARSLDEGVGIAKNGPIPTPPPKGQDGPKFCGKLAKSGLKCQKRSIFGKRGGSDDPKDLPLAPPLQ